MVSKREPGHPGNESGTGAAGPAVGDAAVAWVAGTADSFEPVLPAVARGEARAIEQCLQRYGPAVAALARRRTQDAADAEDAIQEIFLDLWRSAARFDAGRFVEPMFVMMIARRRLIDRQRAHRNRRDREVPIDGFADDLADSGQLPERVTEARLALEVLNELPLAQRRLLDLSITFGLSHAEIAERERLPIGTVKTAIRRGLIRVRQALGIASGGGDL